MTDFKWNTISELTRQRFNTGVTREDKIRAFKRKVPLPGQTACAFADEMYYTRGVCYGTLASSIMPDDELIKRVIDDLPMAYQFELKRLGAMTWPQFKRHLMMLDKIQGKGVMVSAIQSLSQRDPVHTNDQQRRSRSARPRGGWQQRQRHYRADDRDADIDGDTNSYRQKENINTANTTAAQVLCTVTQAPTVASSAANTSQQSKFKDRPCRFCQKEGYGECFHVSWEDCPCKSRTRKGNTNDKRSFDSKQSRDNNNQSWRGRRRQRDRNQPNTTTTPSTTTSAPTTARGAVGSVRYEIDGL